MNWKHDLSHTQGQRPMQMSPRTGSVFDAQQHADAWVTLARAYQPGLLWVPERSAEWIDKWEQAAHRALELAPNSPGAAVMLAQLATQKGNLVEADRLLELSNTSQFTATLGYRTKFLLGVGRSRDALKLATRWRDSEPLDEEASAVYQGVQAMLGNFEQAEAEFQRSLLFIEDASLIRGGAVRRALARGDKNLIREHLSIDAQGDPVLKSLNETMSLLFCSEY